MHGTHRTRATHHVLLTKYEMINPVLQAITAARRLYVPNGTQICAPQFGHGKFGVKRTSSSLIFEAHFGHVVRGEYIRREQHTKDSHCGKEITSVKSA